MPRVGALLPTFKALYRPEKTAMSRVEWPVRLMLLVSATVFCTASLAADDTPSPKPFGHLSWASDDGAKSLDFGGSIRLNHRYEDWKTSSNDPARLLFDIARFEVKGKWDQFYLDGGYTFQDRNRRSIEHALVGYKFQDGDDLQLGIVYKPFGIYPYPENGWTFHIPYFLGYADSAAPGLKYSHPLGDWNLQAAFFPRMIPADRRYTPEVGTYSDLKDNALASLHGQDNEKRNQLDLRLARSWGSDGWKNESGVSLAGSQVYNGTTDRNGTYWAAAAHTTLSKGPWSAQLMGIRYQYNLQNPEGVSDASVLMGANAASPAYLVAAKGDVGLLNIGYTVDTPQLGKVKSVKFYNDYSVLHKDQAQWNSSQMDTLGVKLMAGPIITWLDLTWGKNANPYGGAENGTGWTSTTSSGSNEWYFRTNVNIGYYF